jgi:5-methylcytosine-specific restriction endonuclease McrA
MALARRAPNAKYALCSICAGPIYRFTASNQCSQSCYEKWRRQSGVGPEAAQRVRHRGLVPRLRRVLAQRSVHALGKGDRDALIAYLIERDGNRCRIPGCSYGSRQIGVGARKPSLDHIVPLSKGGKNELANIQLAHFRCNLSKGNRAVGDQLALIG